jgi:uncharacterized membrane protein
MLAPSLRLAVAGDAFFAIYLSSTALLALRLTPQQLRERARYEDEGMFLIVLLTLSATGLCMASILALLGEREPPGMLRLGPTIASVPLGWLTLHTIGAFRYAHLYYENTAPDDEPRKDAEGLAFPGTKEPAIWDFLYYSFVVGMTAQVSDVQVLNTSMRRLTLYHGVTSFFFNTVILALAVNIAATYAH